GRVDFAVVDIRAVAPGLDYDRAARRMLAKDPCRRAGAVAKAPPGQAAFLGDDEIDRAVAAKRENILVLADVRIGLAVLDIRTEAANPGKDRLLALRMLSDFARQRQQGHGLGEGDLALLHIGAKTALPHRNFGAARGVIAQNPDARPLAIGGTVRIGVRQSAREFAFGIIRAADKSAEFAEFQRELTVRARRTGARVRAVLLGGENMRAQELIQTVQHFRRAQILDAGKRPGKIRPEIAQHLLPIELMVRDKIEPLFEAGGKIIADIAGKKALQKSRHQTALIFGDEPLLLDADIVAFAQNREGRGIGRSPPDAELLHAFDKRCFGKARRRLGEMLACLDSVFAEALALAHFGQTAAVFFIFVVAAFLIKLQKSVKANDLAGRAEIEPSLLDERRDI